MKYQIEQRLKEIEERVLRAQRYPPAPPHYNSDRAFLLALVKLYRATLERVESTLDTEGLEESAKAIQEVLNCTPEAACR